MDTRLQRKWTLLLATVLVGAVAAQQQCYFGPGAENRGPSNLVPCMDSGTSACCLLGDTCLSGNTCYNYETGDLYQYGCTDITYQDQTCPYKCNYTESPWVALEYCDDIQSVIDTWTCHAPESCGCQWKPTYDLLVLSPRGCKAMGSDARVAMYAPSKLAPYVSLPETIGGSTGYYSPTMIDGTSSWVETAVSGYTPATITQLTTYRDAPTTPVLIAPSVTPAPSTVAGAKSYAASNSPTESSTLPSASLTTSSGVPPTAAPKPQGLSTGAKVGIGIGAGGGACLVAAIVMAVCFCYRHRGTTDRNDSQERQHSHDPFPSSPQMQYHGYYHPASTEDQKPDWQQQQHPGHTYSPHTPLPGVYFNPHPGQDGSDPRRELPKGNAMVSPLPPTELSASQGIYELGSEVSAASSSSPAPAYASPHDSMRRK